MKETSARPRASRVTWIALVLVSSAALITLSLAHLKPQTSTGAWYTIPILWMIFVVPAAGLLHGHGLRSPDAPHQTPLTPRAASDAAESARAIWSVLTVGIVLSLFAGLLSGSASPAVWPGALMFMLLILTRPAPPA